MSTYVGDSELFLDQFGTPEMRAVFDDRMTVQKWLDTEVALAAAQSELGMIPKRASQAIRKIGDANIYDLTSMKAEMDRTVQRLRQCAVQRLKLFQYCRQICVHWFHWMVADLQRLTLTTYTVV